MLIALTLIAAFVIVILVLAASKPAAFTVQRSTYIEAAPEKIFPFINDFHNWALWSPWEKFDPSMQRTLSGSQSGTGAIYEWSGNKKVGQGRMEIISSLFPSKVVIKLDFLKPFEAHNITEIVLIPNGNGVSLTWKMSGSLNYMMKVMGIFMSMDKLVGKDFETGLSNIKKLLEVRKPTAGQMQGQKKF